MKRKPLGFLLIGLIFLGMAAWDLYRYGYTDLGLDEEYRGYFRDLIILKAVIGLFFTFLCWYFQRERKA